MTIARRRQEEEIVPEPNAVGRKQSLRPRCLCLQNLNSSDSVFPNYRSGGHKLLMLFTDGLDEWPHAVIDEELRNRNGDVVRLGRCPPKSDFPQALIPTTPLQIRMFGFSMGYGTGQLPLLHWMACRTFAKYSGELSFRRNFLPNAYLSRTTSVIDSIMDVKPQSRSFLDHLSVALGRSLENTPIEARRISW